MKVIKAGHQYELPHFGSPDHTQYISFIQKDVAGNLIEDGTTNEEVLSMLIDRMKTLQDKMPCRENAIVITKLEESLMWLNKRTADRKARGVEGTGKA